MKNRKIGKQALDLIYQNSSKHIKAEEAKELIKYINRLRYMSIGNAILVRAQKPECEYATTWFNWEVHNGRKVNKEAKPLIVFGLSGTADYVYALSDTRGRKYHLDWNPPECEEETFHSYYKDLILNMKAIGIDFNKKIFESQKAGGISAVAEGMVTELSYKGEEYLVKKTHTILVNEIQPDREILATIAHELGHLFCNHFNNEHLTHEQEEFEAECVSHIVCSRRRIIYDPKNCLWTYLDANKEISKSSIKRILEAAVEIEEMLKSTYKPINGYIKTSHI